ncbi:MAG: PDZ domain-containing protein [Planctomycetaceae bacterium]
MAMLGLLALASGAVVPAARGQDTVPPAPAGNPLDVLRLDPDRPPAPELPGPESAPADAPASPPVDPQVLAGWIAGLNDDRYEVREESLARLSRAGLSAVEPLEQASRSTSLEQAARAVRALGSVGQTSDLPTFERVQESLERLAGERQRGIGRRAVAELDRLGDARTRHAMRRFEELGGRMKKSRMSNLVQFNNAGLDARPPQAVLNRHWKGTDADLVLLTRIGRLETLYVTRSAPVTPQALEKLRRQMGPTFQIQPRGDAMVGIVGQSQEEGCVVGGIEEGSPAEKAGLKLGDVIRQYNGIELDGFEKLVEITRELKPGTRITLDIIRNETPKQLELELGEFE